MDTPTTSQKITRKYLPTLSKVTMVTTLVSALCFVSLKIITGIGTTQIIAGILVVVALLIVTRIRWVPLISGLLSGFFLFILLFSLHFVTELLTHPQSAMSPLEVPVIVILLVSLALSLIIGIAATVQNYR
jgi:hypothetical protein